MIKKPMFKVVLSFMIVAALLTLLSGLAFAQTGDQGSGSNQGDQSGQSSDDQGNDDNEGNGDNQNNNADQGTGASQNAPANQATGTNQNNAALACAQTYTVLAGDSLSMIANQNNISDYNTIVQANNAAVGTGDNFTNIDDPNNISVGQTLCIPASGATIANTGTDAAQGAAPAAITTSGVNANMTPEQAALLSQSQQGMLIVENMSGGDMIFDLTQPSTGSAWIGPNQQQQFVLTPGQQQFSAHHPTGEFAVAPGTVQVTAGQVVRISCFTNMCQMVQTTPQAGQQQQQSGQQQSGQQIDNSNNNDNGPDLTSDDEDNNAGDGGNNSGGNNQ